MKKPRFNLKQFALESQGRQNGMAQDIDAIKHNLRRLHWQVTSLISFFKVAVPPDSLDEILNPPDSYVNQIVREARFAATSERVTPAKKKKRRKHK